MDVSRLIAVFLYTDFATILFKYSTRSPNECLKHGSPNFFWAKGPVRGLHVTKIIVSGILHSLNFSAICTVYTQFTIVAAGRVMHLGGPPVGHPKRISLFRICFRNTTDTGPPSVKFK
jgi:hypothetical protein